MLCYETISEQLAEIGITDDFDKIAVLMGELISNVNHQCDFYSSTMVVMSCLAKFVEQRSADLKYCLTIISYFSGFYCWEEDIIVDVAIKQCYDEGILYIRNHLLLLLEKNHKEVIAFSENNIELSLCAYFALLDTSSYGKDMARALACGNFDELSIMCTNCNFADETLSLNDESFQQPNICEKWDGRNFSNSSVWIKNIYQGVIDNEIIRWTMIISGVFICPVCEQEQHDKRKNYCIPTLFCVVIQ